MSIERVSLVAAPYAPHPNTREVNHIYNLIWLHHGVTVFLLVHYLVESDYCFMAVELIEVFCMVIITVLANCYEYKVVLVMFLVFMVNNPSRIIYSKEKAGGAPPDLQGWGANTFRHSEDALAPLWF